jgi:hypothetical protein
VRIQSLYARTFYTESEPGRTSAAHKATSRFAQLARYIHLKRLWR